MSKQPCISRELYLLIRNDYLRTFLDSHGFKERRKDFFVRTLGDSCWRISTDFRRDGSCDQGISDVALAIGFYSLNAFLSGFPPLTDRLKGQGVMPCVIASSLAMLTPKDWQYYWIDLSTDPNELASRASSDLELFGVPYSRDFGTLEQCVSLWQKGLAHHRWDTYMNLAAAYWLRGDQDTALNVSERYARKNIVHPGQPIGDIERAQVSQQFHEWLRSQVVGPSSA